MSEHLSLDQKYHTLLGTIAQAGRSGGAAIAFSGGVDSSLLCYAAHEALGDKAIAVTIVSPMLPQSELLCASRVAAQIGITHILVQEDEIDAEVAENPVNRCYFCKKLEFGAVVRTAEEHGIHTVFDGSNLDDQGDYRPGLTALSELGIVSPLREARLQKNDIRELARRYQLAVWDKPAYACLASRIPYGEKIDTGKLARIERSEDALRALGFRQFRVRSHGDLARIEVSPEERPRFFDEALLDRISQTLKSFGFVYVAFELEGYCMGSLNRLISAGSGA
ncbi:MAG: ATP-dependent sacrificial sulfur transferase LarE [Treponema sp.]|nr:ATP-dependent sacrificial sulfur transferase LarE [Treponema sp.]